MGIGTHTHKDWPSKRQLKWSNCILDQELQLAHYRDVELRHSHCLYLGFPTYGDIAEVMESIPNLPYRIIEEMNNAAY